MALNNRIIIEQAKGGLAQLHGVSVDEAFLRIRAYDHLIVTDLASLPGL